MCFLVFVRFCKPWIHFSQMCWIMYLWLFALCTGAVLCDDVTENRPILSFSPKVRLVAGVVLKSCLWDEVHDAPVALRWSRYSHQRCVMSVLGLRSSWTWVDVKSLQLELGLAESGESMNRFASAATFQLQSACSTFGPFVFACRAPSLGLHTNTLWA